jgi:iron complex transport system substrate-binding protein
MRICSLLPGATEVVAALGLGDQLVGISHECDYPPEIRDKPIMVRARVDAECASHEIDRKVRAAVESGDDLYVLDEARLVEARPDLVITQELCDVCAITPPRVRSALDALPRPPRLLSLNPGTLEDMLRDIERIGVAVNEPVRAQDLASSLRRRLQCLHERVAGVTTTPNVVCLEWLDPFYVAGHWVPEMIALAGGQDALGKAAQPSSRITWTELAAAAPDVLILAPCGFSIPRTLRELPLLFAQPQWTSLPAVQTGRVFVVDASAYTSRPGPRLVEGAEVFARIFHPNVFEATLPPGVEHIRLPHTLAPAP